MYPCMYRLQEENLWLAFHHTCLKMHGQHKVSVDKAELGILTSCPGSKDSNAQQSHGF